jgi:tRNA pseudouridine55 synthase
MHSAKKKDGRPLYELAREGIVVEREPKLCHLYSFKIEEYTPPVARFSLTCSSGTYVRTLAQDFARLLGTVGMLDTLNRSFTGAFELKNAWSLAQIEEAVEAGKRWDELPCWVPFDRLLAGYETVEATLTEQQALFNGKQAVLPVIMARLNRREKSGHIVVGQENCVAITCEGRLIAIARSLDGRWELERVFLVE